MQQSTKIAAAIIFGFVIYTTLKGNFRKYLEVIGIV